MTTPRLRHPLRPVSARHASHRLHPPPRPVSRAPRRVTLGKMTTFEQVIIANSVIIVGSTLAAYWVTHQSIEAYHYLIDTLFVAMATVVGVGINALLLRRAFTPLFGMLATIQKVESGKRDQRVSVAGQAEDVAQLARAFNRMLDGLEASRQEGLRDVAQAQESERRRIALELHDATGQELTALILRLELIGQELADLPAIPAKLASQVDETKALAERTLRGVQALSRQLRPAVLDDLGLAAALRWLANELSQGTSVPIVVRLSESATVGVGSTLAETMLFRVAQEALSNASRHSHAHEIYLELQQSGVLYTLMVRDDGCGFREASTADRGLGLQGMRERMSLVGGHCIITSAPGQGTMVTAQVSLSEKTKGNR